MKLKIAILLGLTFLSSCKDERQKIKIIGYIEDKSQDSFISVSNDKDEVFVIQKDDIAKKYKSDKKIAEYKKDFYIIEVYDNSDITLDGTKYTLNAKDFESISQCRSCCEAGCCKPYAVSCQGPQDCWLMGKCLTE
jgi:hypothetical protein